MNGGNCFSLCPISRRRQKPLLPRQTMPLCGRQRPAACTSPALCEPPIATPGSRATAGGTLSQCGTPAGPQGGLVRHPRTTAGHMAMPAQQPGAGRLLWAKAQLLEAGPPSSTAPSQQQQQPPGRGEQGTSIIHTKEKVGRAACRSQRPPCAWARESEHQRPAGCLKSHPFLFPWPVWLRAAGWGRLCSEFGVCTSLSWPLPALTKASGLGCVYMMHSSRERSAPGWLPCSSSRKEARVHGGWGGVGTLRGWVRQCHWEPSLLGQGVTLPPPPGLPVLATLPGHPAHPRGSTGSTLT